MAQTVTIDPVGAVTVEEGTNLTITCTDGVNAGNEFFLLENGVLLAGNSQPPSQKMGRRASSISLWIEQRTATRTDVKT